MPSLPKCEFTLVLLWNIRLAEICMAALLWHVKSTGCFIWTPSSWNSPSNHVNLAMLLNSASTELLEIVSCFFDFQLALSIDLLWFWSSLAERPANPTRFQWQKKEKNLQNNPFFLCLLFLFSFSFFIYFFLVSLT